MYTGRTKERNIESWIILFLTTSADMRQALPRQWRRARTNPIPPRAVSVLTTERHLGCKQNVEGPVSDRFGCLSAPKPVDLR
jgi:hypothetical protein